MQDPINQAVVFTKPVHHLSLPLTAGQLSAQVRAFLEEKGFKIALTRTVTGSELAARDVIKQHYLMYSRGACSESPAELG
ncbi:MAG: hypothetical protein L3J13_09460, partial [Devosiaceae bacterium]|nr:hypothetical protein [Devosiaceae bacterium]